MKYQPHQDDGSIVLDPSSLSLLRQIETLITSLALHYAQGGLLQVVLMGASHQQASSWQHDTIFQWFLEYSKGCQAPFDTALFAHHPNTSAFRQSVWQEVSRIPYGETRTYRDIAFAIGNPLAVRAVGTAIGQNPCMIARPCHRVVGSHGKLGGFAFGLDMKRLLLRHEGIHID